MKSPLINSIRFYDPSGLPNYTTIFPNMDNITQRTMYVDGLNASSYYKEWVNGIELVLQFTKETGDNGDLKVYKLNQTTNAYELSQTLIETNITPAGWSGDSVIKHSFTPTTGVYYLQFNGGLTSDKFVVHSSIKYLKKMVLIQYTNSKNELGAIFYDNLVSMFTGKTFFEGQLKPGSPSVEISSYETDRKEPVKTRTSPTRTAVLNLNNVHYTYIDNITHIFSLDTLQINGIEYENKEAPVIEEKEHSDLVDVTINLIQKNNDYFYIN